MLNEPNARLHVSFPHTIPCRLVRGCAAELTPSWVGGLGAQAWGSIPPCSSRNSSRHGLSIRLRSSHYYQSLGANHLYLALEVLMSPLSLLPWGKQGAASGLQEPFSKGLTRATQQKTPALIRSLGSIKDLEKFCLASDKVSV